MNNSDQQKLADGISMLCGATPSGATLAALERRVERLERLNERSTAASTALYMALLESGVTDADRLAACLEKADRMCKEKEVAAANADAASR